MSMTGYCGNLVLFFFPTLTYKSRIRQIAVTVAQLWYPLLVLAFMKVAMVVTMAEI